MNHMRFMRASACVFSLGWKEGLVALACHYGSKDILLITELLASISDVRPEPVNDKQRGGGGWMFISVLPEWRWKEARRSFVLKERGVWRNESFFFIKQSHAVITLTEAGETFS